MPKRSFLPTTAALLLALAPAVAAKDISVRRDGTGLFASVQAAVDAALDGDRITIAPGQYPEHVTISGKNNLSLVGEGDVTIQTDDPGSVVIAVEKAHGLLLKGLHGVHVSPGCWAPVVTVNDSEDVTVENCDLNGSGTGGVFAESSKNVKVLGNNIHKCTSTGVSLRNVERAEIRDNLIESSQGGISLNGSSDVDVKANTVAKNSDAGLRIESSRAVRVDGNIVAFNKKGWGGTPAGVSQTADSEIVFGVNCVFGNTARDGSASDIGGLADGAAAAQKLADPSFADADTGDFGLKPGSPCAGLGRPDAVTLDKLAQAPPVTPEDQARLAGGIEWASARLRFSGRLPGAAQEGMGGDGFANAALLAKKLIERDLSVSAGTAPQAPTLTQGKYERTTDFEARVAKEKAAYELASRDYALKVSAYPAWRSNYFLETALNEVFGAPRVADSNYNPDTQMFSAGVASASPLAKDVKQTLVLKELIPNDKAPDFDATLRSARPRLRYAVAGGALTLVSAELAVDGKSYPALPTDAAASGKPLTVDIAGLVPGAKTAPSTEMAVHYAKNPELEKEYQKLQELSQAKAQASELESLKKQVAAMEGGAEETKSSDVDAPSYKLAESTSNFAVVIGVEKYPALPAALYADHDARAVHAHLLALGFPERNIMTLTERDATRASMSKALNTWLPNRVKEDSTVFFYYSGHGAPDTSSNSAYLVPIDGDPEALGDTAYPVKQLYEKLGKLKAARVIVALDSCFSGAGGRSVLAKDARPLITKINVGSLAPGKVVALSAASADQISGAVEDQGHGAFTYFLLKGLNGAAADASGVVTVKGLYDYLSPKVSDAARLHNRDQTPVLAGAAPDDSVKLR
ncbi:MAG: right-handed parallel beta-helix repeat-containing protein [Elusimicrobiota bacterium]